MQIGLQMHIPWGSWLDGAALLRFSLLLPSLPPALLQCECRPSDRSSEKCYECHPLAYQSLGPILSNVKVWLQFTVLTASAKFCAGQRKRVATGRSVN